ncbi:MAG: hypothetical protein JSW66_10225 [Phycisphaerales bacterium]|nr:MAG: hypothetical protein JSW66_10225 [Phycisphaerales bacterium]
MYYGWVEDKICALAKADWAVFRKLPWCLVTCIESSHKVKSKMQAGQVAAWEGVCSFLGDGLVVGEGKILELARACNWFNGFDEIWFYEERPAVEKPKAISIIPPPVDLTAVVPSRELLEWIEVSGCVLGLGDGIGMNYITPSKEIAESLTNRE